MCAGLGKPVAAGIHEREEDRAAELGQNRGPRFIERSALSS